MSDLIVHPIFYLGPDRVVQILCRLPILYKVLLGSRMCLQLILRARNLKKGQLEAIKL